MYSLVRTESEPRSLGWALVLFISVLYFSQVRAKIIKSDATKELVSLDITFINCVIVNHKHNKLNMFSSK